MASWVMAVRRLMRGEEELFAWKLPRRPDALGSMIASNQTGMNDVASGTGTI
jgi:hypothetical protein